MGQGSGEAFAQLFNGEKPGVGDVGSEPPSTESVADSRTAQHAALLVLQSQRELFEVLLEFRVFFHLSAVLISLSFAVARALPSSFNHAWEIDAPRTTSRLCLVRELIFLFLLLIFPTLFLLLLFLTCSRSGVVLRAIHIFVVDVILIVQIVRVREGISKLVLAQLNREGFRQVHKGMAVLGAHKQRVKMCLLTVFALQNLRLLLLRLRPEDALVVD